MVRNPYFTPLLAGVLGEGGDVGSEAFGLCGSCERVKGGQLE